MYYYPILCRVIRNIPDFRLVSNVAKEVKKKNHLVNLVYLEIIKGKMKTEISLQINYQFSKIFVFTVLYYHAKIMGYHKCLQLSVHKKSSGSAV